MAIKVRCQQCQGEFPEIVRSDAPRKCPRCGALLERGERSPGRTPSRVLQSQPFAPPPGFPPTGERATSSSPRLGMVAALAVVVLLLGGLVMLARRPASETAASIPGTPLEPAVSSPQSTSPAGQPSAGQRPAETARQPRPKGPRVRMIPVDALPDVEVSVVESTGPSPLTKAVPPEKIDRAVKRGIEFLRNRQKDWLNRSRYSAGYASLGGLALLEAGVPNAEPLVQEAAHRVRGHVAGLTETYEIALSLLFLERLGEAQDAPIIRTLALRLVAGQSPQGGWDYRCPYLPQDLEMPLRDALEKTRPLAPGGAVIRDTGKGLVEVAMPIPATAKKASSKPSAPAASRTTGVRQVSVMMPVDTDAKRVVKELPEPLRGLPVFREIAPELPPGLRALPTLPGMGTRDRDDNSNTQFALLALWAARRHGVATERALLLADRRFAQSQAADGSWGYHVNQRHGLPSMTCVGLLGLALGHGAMLPATAQTQEPATGDASDPAIQKGLEALARSVGDPDRLGAVPLPNLYFLWSLERVAMLYRLPTLGGKDWYGWGAKILVRDQRPDGAWHHGEYPGSDAPLDTAFALLFLRRSNLVRDLSERLHLRMAISDPQKSENRRDSRQE